MKKNHKLPSLKKDIKDFIFSEEGKISKKNIAKIGIYLALLKMMLDPSSADAAYTDQWNYHNSYFKMFTSDQAGHYSQCDIPCGYTDWHNSGGWCL